MSKRESCHLEKLRMTCGFNQVKYVIINHHHSQQINKDDKRTRCRIVNYKNIHEHQLQSDIKHQILQLHKHKGRDIHVHNPGQKNGVIYRAMKVFWGFNEDQHVG